MGDLKIPTGQIAAKASDQARPTSANMSADWTRRRRSPSTTTDIDDLQHAKVSVLYDSLGTKHTLTQYFVKTGANDSHGALHA